MDMYEILKPFAIGFVTGLSAAYAYWKTIPMTKKKAALRDLKEGLKDGKLSLADTIDAIEELF